MSEKRRIIGAWESPHNEGTAVFRVGEPAWYPVRIRPSTWPVGRIAETEDTNGFYWIQVYDHEDRLRAVLPGHAVATELGYDDE